MRVAINALTTQPGGGLTYLRGLLRYLPVLDTAHEYLVFRTDGAPVASPAANVKFVTQPPRSLVARTMWEQVVLPWVLRERGRQTPTFRGGRGGERVAAFARWIYRSTWRGVFGLATPVFGTGPRPRKGENCCAHVNMSNHQRLSTVYVASGSVSAQVGLWRRSLGHGCGRLL